MDKKNDLSKVKTLKFSNFKLELNYENRKEDIIIPLNMNKNCSTALEKLLICNTSEWFGLCTLAEQIELIEILEYLKYTKIVELILFDINSNMNNFDENLMRILINTYFKTVDNPDDYYNYSNKQIAIKIILQALKENNHFNISLLKIVFLESFSLIDISSQGIHDLLTEVLFNFEKKKSSNKLYSYPLQVVELNSFNLIMYKLENTQALDIYTDRLKDNENDIFSLTYLGLYHFLNNDYNKSLSYFENVVKNKKSYSLDSYFNLANIYMMTNNYEEAVKYYIKAITEFSVSAEVLCNLSLALFMINLDGTAKLVSNHLIKISSSSNKSNNNFKIELKEENNQLNLVNICNHNLEKQTQKSEKIEKVYKKSSKKKLYISIGVVIMTISILAITINYLFSISHSGKIKKLNDQSLSEEEYHKKVIEINPKNTTAMNRLGLHYLDKSNHDEAEQQFNKSLEVNPKSSVAYNNLGLLQKSKGNYKLAKEYYLKSISLNPKNSKAYINLGVLSKIQENYDEAFEYYNKAIEIDPKDDITYNNVANLYRVKNDLNKAIEYYLKSLELNENNYLTNRNIAETYELLGDYNSSLKHLLKCYQLNKNDNIILNRLGKLYFDIGDYKSSLTYYKELLNKDSNNVDLFDTIREIQKKTMNSP